MKRNVMTVCIFLIGLTIFLYPIISNIYMSGTQATIINEYEQKISEKTEQELNEMKENAKKYNSENVDKALMVGDPFSTTENASDNSGFYSTLNVGEIIGSIEIPVIDIELPIYPSASEESLSKGVGHLENSSLPVGGKSTHAILSAHRGLPSAEMFRHLDKVAQGDTFYIHVLDEVLAYKVIDIVRVLPNETSTLTVEEGKDLITLVTCDPYMINTHRLLVKGERTPFTAEEKPPEVQEEETVKDNASFMKWGLLLALIVIILGILLYMKYRRKRRNKQDA
ncbi:class C sortase [Kurthia massiliensis]|uniref:class C sortase n=1 Tax=Kurthia massiliensis TaxID=1033739 RepID=UPI0002897282|nr:class C sortase [Kurthia massiliensis]